MPNKLLISKRQLSILNSFAEWIPWKSYSPSNCAPELYTTEDTDRSVRNSPGEVEMLTWEMCPSYTFVPGKIPLASTVTVGVTSKGSLKHKKLVKVLTERGDN